MYLPFEVQDVLSGEAVQAGPMVDLVEVEVRDGRGRGGAAALWLHFATGEVAEAKPFAALGAELWLIVLRDRRELQVDLFPAESVPLPEESDELRHVYWDLLAWRWSCGIGTWSEVLVDSVVVCLEVEIAELVRHEEVAVGVDEGSGLVPSESAGNTTALRQGHDLLAVFAVKDGLLCDLVGSLRGAMTEQLLLDPCSVEVAQELVSSILELLELGVRHAIGNMRHDFRIQIAETDLAAVDDGWKVLEEKLLPDLLVDPLDLEEMASHQLVQAILRRDLEELLLHAEVALFR